MLSWLLQNRNVTCLTVSLPRMRATCSNTVWLAAFVSGLCRGVAPELIAVWGRRRVWPLFDATAQRRSARDLEQTLSGI